MIPEFLLRPYQFSENFVELNVNGADSESFLHNQLTTNVKALKTNEFHQTTAVDLVGKVVAFGFLLKNNDHNFSFLVDKDLCENLVERLDKYLISEDVELNVGDVETFTFYFGPEVQEGFAGFYCGQQVYISKEEFGVDSLNDSQIKIVKLLTGTPQYKVELQGGELLTNTMLVDQAFHQDKGCFPGQETISKILNNRGAAFYPACIKSSVQHDNGDIRIDGKKIGKIYSSVQINADYYHYAELNRENRIDKKELPELGVVHYFPLFDLSQLKKSEYLYELAQDAFHKNDEETAIELLNLAIKYNPTHEDAYEVLGVILGREEKYNEAISKFHELEQINPSSVMAQTNLSLYYMKVGEIEKAEVHKSNATLKQFEELGKIADEKRAKEKLIEREEQEMLKKEGMFKQVLEIDKDDAMANLGLGDIELNRKNFAQAIKYIKTALTTDPKYSVAYVSLAKALIASEDKDEALKVLKTGIEIASKKGDLMPANEMQSMLTNL